MIEIYLKDIMLYKLYRIKLINFIINIMTYLNKIIKYVVNKIIF